jgi:hypothetical protein
MGLAGYYRRFIKGFSKIANPIMELQKKKKNCVWTEKYAEEFQKDQGVFDDIFDIKGP